MMPLLRPATDCIQAWAVEIIELGDHRSISDATHVSGLTCIADVPACGPERALPDDAEVLTCPPAAR